MNIKMTDLNELILICCAELDSLCSSLMDNKIRECLHILVEDEKTFYEFSKFKNFVEDYKFALEFFNKNKKWNFEHELTKTMLSYVNDIREGADISLNNIIRVLAKTKYVTFRDDLKDSVNMLIDSINKYLKMIKQFFEMNCSKQEYENILKNYNLEDLNKLK